MDKQVSVEIRIGGEVEERIVLGERARKKVLAHFNPSEDARVTALKALSAAQIQMMLDHQLAQSRVGNSPATSGADKALADARGRAAAIAITQAEITQMCLVKSLFAEG
jgi:hypothetical protein